MKLPPQIKIKHLAPATDGKNFIIVKRAKYEITYPNNDVHEMHIDTIERIRPDASIIVPYVINDDKTISVWLRSCIRPAAAIRFSNEANQSALEQFNGNFWELAAGLIDENETAVEAAARECMEEVGFPVTTNDVKQFHVSMPISSILAEILYFHFVDVTKLERQEPTLDGSLLEMHGECILVPLQELIQLCDSGKIVDMKTHLGLQLFYNLAKNNGLDT